MRKGVTPVIAIVLLVLMTVGASVLGFVWISNVQSGVQETAGASVETAPGGETSRLQIISVKGDGFTVSNVGTDIIESVTIIINGELTEYDLTEALNPGEAVLIPFVHPLLVNQEHVIKVSTASSVPITKIIISSQATEESGYLNPYICGNNYCEPNENAYNCSADCEKVDIIIYGGRSDDFGMGYFNETLYSVYTTNWSDPVELIQFSNMRLEVAYDSDNNPVIFHAQEYVGGKVNYTYSFWTGSSWKTFESFMLSSESINLLGTSVDFFYDDTAIFVFANSTTTGSNDERNIYYAIGDSNSVSEPVKIFSGMNYTYPIINVDFDDKAHLIFTDYHSLFYSTYDRNADSWSNPEVIFNNSPGTLQLPEMLYDHDGNGLLVFHNFTDFSWEFGNLSYSYYSGSSFSDPIPFAHANFTTNAMCGYYPELGYDNTQWIIRYLGESGMGTCNDYYRTYSDNGGLSGEQQITNPFMTLLPDYMPVYYNKQGSNVFFFVSHNGSNVNTHTQIWNGTAFETYEDLEYALQSSCPFVYTYNGRDWVFEHESYGFAVFEGWEYESYETLKHLTPVDDKLYLELREELYETSYTNKLSLKMVEHEPTQEVYFDVEGVLHTISEWNYPITCSQDCVNEVSKADGSSWTTEVVGLDVFEESDLRDELILTFNKPIGTVSPKLMLRLKDTSGIGKSWLLVNNLIGKNNQRFFYDVMNSVPILKDLFTNWRKEVADLKISVWDGSEWVEAGNFGVGGALWNNILIELDEVSTDDLMIKLEFSSYTYYFDEIKADYSIDEPVIINELLMNEEVPSLLYDDDEYLILNQGEKKSLVFDDEPCSVGKKCSYLVSVKGYYEIEPDIEEVILTPSLLNQLLYFLTNPIESIRYSFRSFFGDNPELPEVTFFDTLVSYFS